MAQTFRILGLLVFFGLGFTARGSELPTARNEWRLVWSDEFNENGAPDPKHWNYETGGGGWGNSELEFYTARPENTRVEDGNLVIETRKEQYQGSDYTSARLTTQGKGAWKYGRFEIRAKLPGGAGTWPAIWFLPTHGLYGNMGWPDNGEIDLMEHVGSDPQHILGSFYTKNSNWMQESGKTVFLPVLNPESEYHIYAMEWDDQEASMYVDDNKYVTLTNPHTTWMDWPFDNDFYLILNVALGGFGGDVDDSALPQKMLIDYVRVFEKASGPHPEEVLSYFEKPLQCGEVSCASQDLFITI
jgi:beta-glucanase (GH16 family)